MAFSLSSVHAKPKDPFPGWAAPEGDEIFFRGWGRELTPAESIEAADAIIERANAPRAMATAQLMRGLARFRQGRYRSAASDLAAAVEGGAVNADLAMYFQAESLFHAGDYADAEGIWKALKRAHRGSLWRHRATVRLGDCHMALGRPGKAAKALGRALAEYPEYPHRAAIRYALAEAERLRGDLNASAAWLDAIIWELPEDPLNHVARRSLGALEAQGAVVPRLPVTKAYARGVDLRKRKYFFPALDVLGRLLTDDRAKPAERFKAQYQIGRTLFQMERYSEALATFEAVKPDAPSGWWRRRVERWRSYTLERLGRLDASAKALFAGMGNPERPSGEALYKAGWLYFDGAQYKKAQEYFLLASKRGREWGSKTHFLRTWLAYRLGKYEKALKSFRAMHKRSRWRPARYGYWAARTLTRMGKLEEASDTYRDIITSSPLSYYAYQARLRLEELNQPPTAEPTAVEDLTVTDSRETPAEPGVACEAGSERPGCRLVLAGPMSLPEDESGEEPVLMNGATDAGPPDAAPVKADAVVDAGAGDTRPSVVAEAAPTSEAAPPAPTTPAPAESGRLLTWDAVSLLRRMAQEWGGAFPAYTAAYELAVIGEYQWAFQQLRQVSDENRAFYRATGGQRSRWGYLNEPYVDYREGPVRGEWGRIKKEKPVRSSKRRIRFLRSRRPTHFWPLMRDTYAALGDFHYARRHSRAEDKVSGPPEGAGNAKWRRRYARAFKPVVEKHAAHYGLDSAFIWALMTVESTYNPWAVSRAGARGLMQVMPHTGGLVADRMGWRNFGPALLFEPPVAIEMAAWYFHQLIEKFQGQLPLAIAGYNAGPHRVAMWLGRKGHLPMDEFIEEIPYTEAREYTKKVLRYLALYRRIYRGEANLRVGQVINPEFRSNINF